MKNNKIFYIILAWTVIILLMICHSEVPILLGKEVLLKTAPYDPRDLMRGNYIELTFEEISNDRELYGGKVYTVIKTDENNVAHLVKMTSTKPQEGLFIKGKKAYTGYARVTYGIEHYFASKKEIKEIEGVHRSREKDIYAKVKIDKFGNARLIKLIY